MTMEVFWQYEKTSDFLSDLRAFATSLDSYQMEIDLSVDEDAQSVFIHNGEYQLGSEGRGNRFSCPKCSNGKFHVMEGSISGKPALGLCCSSCETYGSVFPGGR